MTVTAAAGTVTLPGLRAGEPHLLHRSDRVYPETNCYMDIIIELLHARGHEPLAVLGTTLCEDFEGDQWTFFKPDPADLRRLFGIDVHELQPYRPLPDLALEQLGAGRTLTIELDSFYLPDTEATSYRRAHVKSSVVVAGIDAERQRLDYFHNTGRHELSGEDYARVLRVDGPAGPDVLPPYTELVRFDAGEPLSGEQLRAAVRGRLGVHLSRRPADNPVARFGARLAEDLPQLVAEDLEAYHDYAFATARMAGAAFELASAHVRWALEREGERAAASFDTLVAGCKVLSLRLARRRVFEVAPLIEPLAQAWDDAMTALDRAA